MPRDIAGSSSRSVRDRRGGDKRGSLTRRPFEPSSGSSGGGSPTRQLKAAAARGRLEQQQRRTQILERVQRGVPVSLAPRAYFAFWAWQMSTPSRAGLFLRDLVLVLIQVEAQLVANPGGGGRGGGGRGGTPVDLAFTLQSIVSTIAFIDLTVHRVSSSVVSEVCELWCAHRQDASLDSSRATHAEVHAWGEAGYALGFLERRVKRHSTNALAAKDLVVRCCVASAGLGPRAGGGAGLASAFGPGIMSPTGAAGSYTKKNKRSKKNASGDPASSGGGGSGGGGGGGGESFAEIQKHLKYSQDIYDRATLPAHPSLGDLAGDSAYRAYHRLISTPSDVAYIYPCLQRSLVGKNAEHASADVLMLGSVGSASVLSATAATEAFQMLLTLMRPLHTQMTMGSATESTMAQALSVMMLMYNMLTLHPAVLTNYLGAAATAVEPLTTWPSPFGDVALLLISALHVEQKAPGISMWKRTLDDMPVLTHHGQHISDICMETIESVLTQEKKHVVPDRDLRRGGGGDGGDSGSNYNNSRSLSAMGGEAGVSDRKSIAETVRGARHGQTSAKHTADSGADLAGLKTSLRRSVRMSVSGYSYASPPGSPRLARGSSSRGKRPRPKSLRYVSPQRQHTAPDFNPRGRDTHSKHDVFNPMGGSGTPRSGSAAYASATAAAAAAAPASTSASSSASVRQRSTSQAPYATRARAASRFSSEVPSLRWSSAVRERRMSMVEPNVAGWASRGNDMAGQRISTGGSTGTRRPGSCRLMSRSTQSLSDDFYDLLKNINADELELVQSVRCWELISSSCFVYLASEAQNPRAWLYASLWESAQEDDADAQETSHQNKIDQVRRNLLLSTLAWDIDLSSYLDGSRLEAKKAAAAAARRKAGGGEEEEATVAAGAGDDQRDDPLGLAKAPPEIMRQWFATARQCLTQASRMASVKEAHAYRAKILAQLLRQIVGESSAIVYLKSSTGAPAGVNQVLPSGELVKGPKRPRKKDPFKKEPPARSRSAPRSQSTVAMKAQDPNMFRGREFLSKSHEEAVELQFRPVQDASGLERLDTALHGDQATGGRSKLGLPLGMMDSCTPAVTGRRRYLKYLPDFDDIEDIALSARMPTSAMEDMAATMNMSTPMRTKISKLRGDATEFLAEARRRLSATSAWQTDGSAVASGDGDHEGKDVGAANDREGRRSLILSEARRSSMSDGRGEGGEAIAGRSFPSPSKPPRRGQSPGGKRTSLESLVDMNAGAPRGKKMRRRLSVRKSISAWSDPVGYILNDPSNAGVAHEMEMQRRAHSAVASDVQRRFAFDGQHMTMGIEQVRNSVMRMAVLGGTSVLHRLVCAFVAVHHLHASDPTWLDVVDFRVYVVPVGHTDLGWYLGEHDSWYYRQIFGPFSTSLLSVPRLSPLMTARGDGMNDGATKGATDEENPNIGPHAILPTLLQNYITEARQVLPVAIFDCECWFPFGVVNEDSERANRNSSFTRGSKAGSADGGSSKGSGGGNGSGGGSGKNADTPHVTIPFCSRMTLGLHTKVALFAKNTRPGGPHNAENEWSSVLTSKTFAATQRSQAENLDITYTEVGLDGMEQDPQSVSDAFHVVAMMNLPAYKKAHGNDHVGVQLDPSLPMHALPDPTSYTLDMCLIGAQGSVHDILKKTTLKEDDVDLLHTAMRAELSQLSVTKIDIRSRNKRPISICLDGEVFGPFVRIVIKPCEAIGSKDRLSLPVMHHFPLSAGHS